jgi:hypothetical protein
MFIVLDKHIVSHLVAHLSMSCLLCVHQLLANVPIGHSTWLTEHLFVSVFGMTYAAMIHAVGFACGDEANSLYPYTCYPIADLPTYLFFTRRN